MEFIDRYREIINELMDKSFPELKNIKIHLEIKKLENSSMWAKRTFLGKYIVIIDPLKYKNANYNQIEGALAHEFVHFVDYKMQNIFMFLLDKILYKFRGYKIKKERETDRKAIQRGFAKQLYSNRKFRIKKSTKKYIKNILIFYMSPNEIKSYAKSIGKW